MVKRLVIIVLTTIACVYLALCGFLFAKQRMFIFPAPTELAPTRMTRVEVPGHTFFLMKESPGGGPVVVRFHGNGEQVAWSAWNADFWADRGVSFVAVEYPGYPGTKGEPSEDALVDACEAALKALPFDRSRLILEGQSLGTGVAMKLAAKGWGTKLVLLSPYTSLSDVAARAFPIFPTRLLLRDRFDSAAIATNVKVPVLVIHGTKDDVIPFELGKKLAGKIAGAQFFEATGAGHNDLWDRQDVQVAITTFVTTK